MNIHVAFNPAEIAMTVKIETEYSIIMHTTLKNPLHHKQAPACCATTVTTLAPKFYQLYKE